MFASINSSTLFGIQGAPVSVEVHIGAGLPGFSVVGLPDEACREARDRVRAALLSSGFEWPNRRITVNLAPSDRRKGGSGLDLALAIGMLVAQGKIDQAATDGIGFVAELGLDGSLKHVSGTAPLVAAMRDLHVVVASAAGGDALVAAPRRVAVADTLGDVVLGLQRAVEWRDAVRDVAHDEVAPTLDMGDVRGQPVARRAAEVSAAGGHNLLLVGGPGGGKTMLAERIPSLLPPLDGHDALTATMIRSAAGQRLGGLVRLAPFRAPHHSASMAAMIGGGSGAVRPGEVSLAHGGVLFLDEVGEFAPSVLDALRQPLESGEIRLARSGATLTLPARFLLVGATNPCPCGGGAPGSCVCNEVARQRYLRRLSGPLLDRFDLRVAVAATSPADLVDTGPGESTAVMRLRVDEARWIADARQGKSNARLSPSELDEHAPLSAEARALLLAELEAGRLSGRGYHRVRRVARTLGDLDGGGADVVCLDHVREAIALRARVGAMQ
ncbi:MAG: YifB family Mg chelatase-like AAA ATPase [Actinobacteria bacterium]|nr:YifB family Mg chelatase-like AAA ATPase [Actinomycetota bacterium]